VSRRLGTDRIGYTSKRRTIWSASTSARPPH